MPSDVALKDKHQQLEKAETDKDKLKAEENKSNLAVAKVQAELDVLAAQLADLAFVNLNDLKKQLQDASDAVKKAEQASGQAEKLTGELEKKKLGLPP